MTDVDGTTLAAAGFSGEIVGPADPPYEDLRRVFNAMIDRHPGLIARCSDTSDVSAAINFARDNGLPVSVYGGGHSFAGHSVCDDGVMIDLRPMRGIEVDGGERSCRAEAGVTWRELDAATQEQGLAVTGGRISSTGIAGLALGGGSGWLERKCGYTADNLVSVEIVTADGQLLTASELENPHLFWGTRGGGGNFGVVTSFNFRLHQIGPVVLAGILMYPAQMAAPVLANFREVMVDAPDELGSAAALITAPPEEFVPEPLCGEPVVGVVVCYAGPIEDGEEALRPLREFGPPAIDMVAPMPYVVVQQLFDPGSPDGIRNYTAADFLSGLPDEAIEAMCRYHLSKPSPLTEIVALPGGGATARLPDDAMAFGQRQAPFNYVVHTKWTDPADDEANIAWTRELGAALKPFATGRVYLNYIGEEGDDRVVAAFGPKAYTRLQALKDRYDPNNLFRLNQNIRPSGALGLRARASAYDADGSSSARSRV
jgi:FAD/FMN-containing dehydrogenase